MLREAHERHAHQGVALLRSQWKSLLALLARLATVGVGPARTDSSADYHFWGIHARLLKAQESGGTSDAVPESAVHATAEFWGLPRRWLSLANPEQSN